MRFQVLTAASMMFRAQKTALNSIFNTLTWSVKLPSFHQHATCHPVPATCKLWSKVLKGWGILNTAPCYKKKRLWIIMKSKDVLLLCHAGAEGESKYSSYSFLTSALHGGKWSECHPGCALPWVKGPWFRLDRKLGGPQGRTGYRG
jgi:hypothetical protein